MEEPMSVFTIAMNGMRRAAATMKRLGDKMSI
jgi:hypothetical protein